jgi:hypothetical protein
LPLAARQEAQTPHALAPVGPSPRAPDAQQRGSELYEENVQTVRVKGPV